jgi:ABC-type iron transport system FetAB permease component
VNISQQDARNVSDAPASASPDGMAIADSITHASSPNIAEPKMVGNVSMPGAYTGWGI